MKTLRTYPIVTAIVIAGLISGCSDSDDDGVSGPDGMDIDTAGFAFSTADVSEYTRVDRMGMPAIATALIAYNLADPDDDLNNDFLGEIATSLSALHAALDDDLTNAGLVPCTVVGDGTGSCVAAAGQFIIPDTIKIDTSADAAFPNGRLLTDPVIDITLALALLELTDEAVAQTPASLVGVLNPIANDAEFSDDFPFLAAPNM